MSRVVVIEKNKNGNIELTKDELQKMLDDAYNQGYSDGTFRRYDTITYPSNNQWYVTTSNTAVSNASSTIDSIAVDLKGGEA